MKIAIPLALALLAGCAAPKVEPASPNVARAAPADPFAVDRVTRRR